MQLCGAKISARLLPQTDSLKAGETMALRVVLVNSGLAGADVQVSCVLPEGLSLVTDEETETEPETEPEEAMGGEAESALPTEADDGRGADAEPVLADEETLAEPEIRQENGAAVFSPAHRRGGGGCGDARGDAARSRGRAAGKTSKSAFWARRWPGRPTRAKRSSARRPVCACISRWCSG